MLAGYDCAPTVAGNTDHGLSGCSTTGPGQSKDGKNISTRFFPVLPPLIDTFSDSSCSA
jgi:hypothetical protein